MPPAFGLQDPNRKEKKTQVVAGWARNWAWAKAQLAAPLQFGFGGELSFYQTRIYLKKLERFLNKGKIVK